MSHKVEDNLYDEIELIGKNLKTSLTEFAQKVREEADIVDIIGTFVRLKRSGSGYKGLCPFHKEKTPSFHVHPGKQIFHCFGCGVGGDVIKFWMMHERVRFTEAAEQLAHRLGIPIPRFTFSKKDESAEKTRRDLLAVNEFALGYFRKIFSSTEGRKAQLYLKDRGLTKELVDRFSIGFAPDGWENLIRAAEKKGFSPEILEKAGLVLPGKKGSGYYDRFRNRVIFPIFDVQGRCVAFGGRILGEGEPKYLNSPETDIYKKGKLLYGLNLARRELTETSPALIVEGYMDLIALHKYGFTRCAATLGTALTDGHARLLKRYVREVIFIYDGDEAGQNAMIRGCEVLLGRSLSVSVVMLAEGDDPDTFLQKHGSEEFQDILDQKKDFLEFYLDIISEKHDFKSAAGKISALEALKPVMDRVVQPVLFKDCIRRISERLRLEENVVIRHLRTRSRYRREAAEEIIQRQTVKCSAVEAGFLRLVVDHPELRKEAEPVFREKWIFSPLVMKNVEKIYTESEKEHTFETLIESSEESEQAFLREIFFMESFEMEPRVLLTHLMKRLQALHTERTRRKMIEDLKKLEETSEKDDQSENITKMIHENSRRIIEVRSTFSSKEI